MFYPTVEQLERLDKACEQFNCKRQYFVRAMFEQALNEYEAKYGNR